MEQLFHPVDGAVNPVFMGRGSQRTSLLWQVGSGECPYSGSSCIVDLTHTNIIPEIPEKKGEISIPLRDCGDMVCWGQGHIRFSASSAEMRF